MEVEIKRKGDCDDYFLVSEHTFLYENELSKGGAEYHTHVNLKNMKT